MQTLFRGIVRGVVRPTFNPRVPVPRQRSLLGLETRLRWPPRGVQCRDVTLGGVAAQQLKASQASDAVILYLHGGAYCAGSPKTHRNLCSHLAHAARCTVYTLDYRLAPEDPYPAGLEDALSAYRALLSQGVNPDHIALAGDSAGGGLSLALAQRIRDGNLAPPAALYLISPWADLTLSGESVHSRAARDPMLTEAWLRASISHYAGDANPADPLISPVFADFKNLPPMLIQTGSDEMIYSDAERVAERARAAGIDVKLQVHDGLWHVFQLFAGMMSASTAAVRDAGEYLMGRWKNAEGSRS